MKYAVIGIVGFITLSIGFAIGQHQPRFEKIYLQSIDEGYAEPTDFQVFHDRDTGNEIVCVRVNGRADANSCFLSGRKW